MSRVMGRIRIAWHVYRHGHSVTVAHVTVPMFDMSSKGWLYKCECGLVEAA